jgi:hypothetical protein
MASIGNDPNGYRRVLFVAPDGRRKTVRLGKVSSKVAESIRYRIESLLSALIVGTMDRDTSLWVAEITERNQELRTKLEKVGLLEPIEPIPQEQGRSMAKFLDDFIFSECSLEEAFYCHRMESGCSNAQREHA